MAQTNPQLLDRLVTALQDLPEDKVREVIDFAGFLRAQHQPQTAPGGTAEAIAHALDGIGPLQFEDGELDNLLAELEQMHAQDMNNAASLSA